ncbi:cytochrome P450 [Nocardioides humi]|uniref:Cytochrome P450 n=1 Tax=Nocardioides humi TaxID=449461 RepID=A0ABN2B3H7_9ACTN|nr:cytochrome P450 [Nocardioides humi]
MTHSESTWPQRREAGCPIDPPAVIARLREEHAGPARVRLYDGTTPWLVTRYRDVKAVLADRAMSADPRTPGFPHPSEKTKVGRSKLRNFQRMDPPEHDDHRRMLAPAFSLANVEQKRPFVEETVELLLDDLEKSGPGADLVSLVAEPLPARVTCQLLGLPLSDSEFFQYCVKTWTSETKSPEEGARASEELLQYFADLVADRNEHRGEDLVSQMIRDHVDPGRLSLDELEHMLFLLLVGGFDTTANMIAVGMLVLFQNPEQLVQLRRSPDLWPGAIEELLRYVTPAHEVGYRLALEDREVGGCPVSAGEGVIAPIMAANRDPNVFVDPDRLDIHRNARHHVAFGFGVHQCLGQPLARLELSIVFRRLLERFPDLHLACEPHELEYTEALVVGVHSLPVAW